jgi:hypothetical protein
MGIFSRRYLQRCIDESSGFASLQARKLWVKKLNSPSSADYVSTEWEIAILQGLSTLGKIVHEPIFGGSSKLDLAFSSPELNFAADITAISDKGLHQLNPLEELEEELRQRYSESGISTGGFALSVIAASWSPMRGRKTLVIVPPKRGFATLIFNAQYQEFVKGIKSNPQLQRSYGVIYGTPAQSKIDILYTPGRIGAYCQHYTAYTITTVLDKNPLYKALKDKASQLRRSGYDGRLGIIACNGGAHSLNEARGLYSYSTGDIVQEFLRRYSTVDFVVTIATQGLDSSTVKQRMKGTIHVREIEPWHAELEPVFSKLSERLPQVTQSPENARRERKFYRGRETLRPHLGGLTLSSKNQRPEIRMSTRTLLDLLAGKLSQKQFADAYKVGSDRNIFEVQLLRGCLIKAASVQVSPDQDDDEIIFTFSEPDPAVAAFVLKDAMKRQN